MLSAKAPQGVGALCPSMDTWSHHAIAPTEMVKPLAFAALVALISLVGAQFQEFVVPDFKGFHDPLQGRRQVTCGAPGTPVFGRIVSQSGSKPGDTVRRRHDAHVLLVHNLTPRPLTHLPPPLLSHLSTYRR